jgi:poly(A) polymerase Pap1
MRPNTSILQGVVRGACIIEDHDRNMRQLKRSWFKSDHINAYKKWLSGHLFMTKSSISL